MEIIVSGEVPTQVATDLLLVPVLEGAPPAGPPGADARLDAAIRDSAAAEDFRGRPGQSLVLSTLGTMAAGRLGLLGAATGADTRAALNLGADAARLATRCGARTPTLMVGGLQLDTFTAVDALTRGLLLGGYRFDRYLTGERRPRPAPQKVTLLLPSSTPEQQARCMDAVRRAERVALAQRLARDLVNEPAGVLTPRQLADHATDLARAHGLRCEVLDPDECRQLGMGLFLAVGQGSAEPPRFIHVSWVPPQPRKRVALVGKGVTFDSGGLSLKTREGMLGMKSDMAGAAAVVAAACVAADEQLPIEVHALAPCCENMPSGTAVRLNDVIRSLDGRTVEITNTDAEGRLILADALTYARRLSPDAIVDVATLTGACVVALGPHVGGVMSNDDALCTAWLDASRQAGEDMWRLPLPPRLFEQLHSDIADLRNSGDRHGGALIAALFLREFVADTPWVHADIAGPAMSDKEHGPYTKGATGFAVPTLIELLRRM